jgi:hypothetical protein
MGETLLADVIRQVIQADAHVATPLLVDDEAASYYLRYGFVPLPGNPHRLAARLLDIRKTFGLDQHCTGEMELKHSSQAILSIRP